jgi:membrane protein
MAPAMECLLGRCTASSGSPRHWRRMDAGLLLVVSRLSARRLVVDLLEHDAFGAAGSIAFWFFLSLVPLLVIAGLVLGQFARARGMDALTGPLLEIVPGSAGDLVRSEIERLAGSRAASVAPLGIIGFLWTASSGLHNLMDVFEVAVHARRQPWWWQRVMAVGWVLLGLATACATAIVLVQVDSLGEHPEVAGAPAPSTSASASSRGGRSTDRAQGHAASPLHAHPDLRQRVHKALHTPGEEAFAALLSLVAGTALLAAFYRFAVEHPSDVRRRIWPGAVAAVASWLAVSWGFGVYAASLANYALYYGSLTAVAILMLWLYLTSLTLVVGAEVNAQLEGVRSPSSVRPR